MNGKKTLISKLKISIFLIAILPTIIITVLFYFVSRDAINKSLATFSSEMEGLNYATFRINRYIKDHMIAIMDAANSERFIKSDILTKKEILRKKFTKISGVKNVKYYDSSGTLVFNINISDPETETISYYRKNWIDKALSGGVSRSNVFFRENGEPIVNFTVPVLSDENQQQMKVDGVLSVYLSLEDLFSQLDNFIRKKNGLAYILDHRGVLIYVTGELQETFPNLTPGTLMERARAGGYELQTTDKQLYLVSSLPIGDTGWQLVWKAPLSDIAATSKQFLYNFAGAFVLSLLFAMLLYLYVTRRISKPLEKLMEATRNLASGVYDKELAVKKESDEIGALAMSFEEMRNKLKNYMQTNKDLYSKTRQRLEKRIKELRTIHTVTETFATVQDIEVLSNSIAQEVQTVMQARFCNLYLKNEKGKFILKAHSCPVDVDYSKYSFTEFPIDKDPFSEIRSSLSALIIHNIEDEQSLKSHFPRADIGAYCAFPLFTIKDFYGVMEIGLKKKHDLAEGSIRLITTLAKEASISIENAILYKKMEEEKNKIEAILGTVNDGVMSMNIDGIITSFNRAAENITGFSREEVIGKPCQKIFRGIQEEKDSRRTFCTETGCILKMAYQQGQTPFSSEHMVLTPGGGQKILEFVTTLEKDQVSGEVVFVSVFRDISEIKELEKLRSNFIDTISHELRTPLTSIKGYVSTLLHPRAKFSPQESIEFLEIINDESNRLNRLINDLLEASRLHRDALVIKPRPFRINDFIMDLVERKRATTTIHNIVAELEGVPHIYADPDRIHFVLNQLVDNAIKFSPSGGKILIKMTSREKSVSFVVEDEGIGVPENQRNKIFDIFHRVNNRSTRKVYGPGLGLFISKKIIEAHGQKIWVESRQPQGARFVFTLPKYIEPEPGICPIDEEKEN